MKKSAAILIMIFCLFALCSCAEDQAAFKEEISFADLKQKIQDTTGSDGEMGDLHSLLAVFPDTVEEKNVVEAHFVQRDGLFDGCYFFYLKCQYEEQSFSAEIERLKNIRIEFESGKSKDLIYSENIFQYPAFIAILDGYDTYEYALVDRSSMQIVYIMDQLFTFDELSLPEEYLPSVKALPEDLCDEGKEGYTVYYEDGIQGD